MERKTWLGPDLRAICRLSTRPSRRSVDGGRTWFRDEQGVNGDDECDGRDGKVVDYRIADEDRSGSETVGVGAAGGEG